MLLLTVGLFAASTAVAPARDMPVVNPIPEPTFCPETPMSLARKLGKRPPRAVPLTRLPPGQTFMAVDRRIGGCPAPLTMIEYRRAGRR
jgi:hypothetical protein